MDYLEMVLELTQNLELIVINILQDLFFRHLLKNIIHFKKETKKPMFSIIAIYIIQNCFSKIVLFTEFDLRNFQYFKIILSEKCKKE